MAIENSEYRQWISTIERRFRQQQIKAAVQVNSSKIEFYWSLGRDICEMHVEERWGESVIKQLSEDLRHVIDEAKGLTPGNLYYCKRFYLLYSQLFEKVPQVEEKSPSSCGCGLEISPLQIVPQVGEIFKPLHTITENQMLPLNIFAIPWGHHKAILDRCENEPMKALFYAAKTLEHSWSRAVLENMMGDKGKDNGLYERQGKSVNNFPATMPYPTGDLAAEARITYLLSIVSKDTTSQSPLQHTREFRFCRIILMMLCQVLKIWKQSYQCRFTYNRKDMCSDEISNGKLLEGELDKNKTLSEMETVVNG